ncbi:unnamed protein product [Ectocarpus sp. 4 AP-2014]
MSAEVDRIAVDVEPERDGRCHSSSSRCLQAFRVALQQTCLDRESWYASTTQLQLASLPFCLACRDSVTLCLTVDDSIPRRLLAGVSADEAVRAPAGPRQRGRSRVPRFQVREVTWHRRSSVELSARIYALAEADFFFVDGGFNSGVDAVAWPAKLRRLEFGDYFNQPIAGASWPASLEQLTFGCNFNQSVEDMSWPSSLQEVAFLGNFNQSIEGVTWPSSLQQLTFGREFDQPIEEVLWPASLQQLTFGLKFNQPVQGVAWPASLKQLAFGDDFDHPLEQEADWLKSLEYLCLGRWFNQSLDGIGRWAPDLEELKLRVDGQEYGLSLAAVVWPIGLKKMTVDKTLWDKHSAAFPVGVDWDVFFHH